MPESKHKKKIPNFQWRTLPKNHPKQLVKKSIILGNYSKYITNNLDDILLSESKIMPIWKPDEYREEKLFVRTDFCVVISSLRWMLIELFCQHIQMNVHLFITLNVTWIHLSTCSFYCLYMPLSNVNEIVLSICVNHYETSNVLTNRVI